MRVTGPHPTHLLMCMTEGLASQPLISEQCLQVRIWKRKNNGFGSSSDCATSLEPFNELLM